MKRKLLSYCLLGAPLGLALSTLITMGISICVGDGTYHAVVPALADDLGGELNAVLIQALCSMLYGAMWAGASLIWSVERWSMLRQTATHLVVCSLATLPTAYFMRWMERSAAGIASYFGVFMAIYAVIWLAMYLSMRRKVLQINARLGKGT